MSISTGRIDSRERVAVTVGQFAPGVTAEDARLRLDKASFLTEEFDDRGGEDRFETVLVLPASNRTREHTLRAVTVFRADVVTSTVELLTVERGWTMFDVLPAGRAAAVAADAEGSDSVRREALLREVQTRQLLYATHVLS